MDQPGDWMLLAANGPELLDMVPLKGTLKDCVEIAMQYIKVFKEVVNVNVTAMCFGPDGTVHTMEMID